MHTFAGNASTLNAKIINQNTAWQAMWLQSFWFKMSSYLAGIEYMQMSLESACKTAYKHNETKTALEQKV